MELTTKAEPIFSEFKGLCGFCVSSFSAFGGISLLDANKKEEKT